MQLESDKTSRTWIPRYQPCAGLPGTLTSDLREPLLDEILELACGANDFFLASWCESVLPFLTSSQFDSLTTHVGSIDNVFIRSQMMAIMIPRCADLHGVAAALEVARSIEYETERAAGLVQLLPQIKRSKRRVVVARVVDVIERVEEEVYRKAYCDAADYYMGNAAVFFRLVILQRSWRIDILEKLHQFLSPSQHGRIVKVVLPDVPAEELFDVDLSLQAQALHLVGGRLIDEERDYHFERLFKGLTDERFEALRFLNCGVNWLYLAASGQPEKQVRLQRMGVRPS